jgi:hypothetical protein
VAYTSAPEKQTYSTERVPLAYPLKLRAGNQNWYGFAPLQVQDEGMVNALPVKGNKDEPLKAVTRPAINGTHINNTSEAGLVRGMYVWEKTAGTVYYFMVVGTKVYTTSGTGLVPSASSWTNVTTLSTSTTTPVRFSEFIDATNVKKLVLVDGVEGFVFTSNAAGTKITDADFPNPHVPFPVFLNGRLFLAKAGTGDIYNSDLNDPAVWTAGSYISTEVFPDDIQALAKIDNYLLAIGTQSCEYFYDAANATGTPLARQEGAILPFGCHFPNSIAVNKDALVMLANTNDGQSVFMAVEKLNHSVIDSNGVVPMYHRLLTNPALGFEIAAASCRGYFFRQDGVLYYSFLFDGVRGGAYRTALFDACYTYSFGSKAWTELQYGSDTTDRDNRYAFPVQAAASSTTGASTTYVAGNVGTTNLAFFGILDDLTGADIITSLENAQFYLEFRTPNLDFGTMNRKFMSRLALVSESHDSTLYNLWYVMWNDQDFQYLKWTTPRRLGVENAETNEDQYPFVTQLGQFRRRSFRLYCTTGKVISTGFLECDINKGQQ